MKYMFLGGAGEVGASCLLILTADRNILIDCGIQHFDLTFFDVFTTIKDGSLHFR